MSENAVLSANNDILRAINSVLKKGDRVELIPTKDGVRVIHIRRENVDVNKGKTKQ